MAYSKEQILEHYAEEAQRHGLEGTSTIQDLRTRILEIQAILSYLKKGQKVLEVGCGNGYSAQQIVERIDVTLDAIDFSPQMIQLACRRVPDCPKGRVVFQEADILKYDRKEVFDLIFTERCLQNLCSWQEQQMAFANIAAALKKGAEFVMLESFWTGFNNLNAARKELDLPEVPPVWHNLYFDEDQTKATLASMGIKVVDQNPFLSGYYFGSRVILPAITPRSKTVTAQSVLNDYFWTLPGAGDFCPMKILRFRKSD